MSAIALDPLIAEAKARTRRRRLIALGVIVVAAAVAIGVTLATGAVHNANGPLAVGRFDSSGGRSHALVDAVSSEAGVTWAGDGHDLWLTTNGGATWRASVISHLVDYDSTFLGQVEFLDQRHGWVSGDGKGVPSRQGRTSRRWEIDRTTDGGMTWRFSTLPRCRGCKYGSLSFVDARHGYVLVYAPDPAITTGLGTGLSGGTKLYATVDGGASWRFVSKPPFPAPAVARFADAKHGVAVTWTAGMGGDTRLYRTADGGRTWRPFLLPLSFRPAYLKYRGRFVYPGWIGTPEITLVGGTLVIPASRDARGPGAQPVVYTSGDGGAHWQTHLTPGHVGFGYGLFSAASPDTWVAVDSHSSRLFETTDAGATWHAVLLPGPRRLWDLRWIHFTSAQVGWAVLADSRLVRTTDGGLHWKLAGPPKPNRHRHR